MKSTLLIAALAGVSLASPVLAVTAPPPVSSASATASQPKPSVVVAPANLPRVFAGTTIEVEFTLDPDGHPQNIRVLSVFDARVKREVVKAFSQWQFETAGAASPAQGRRYVLPIGIAP